MNNYNTHCPNCKNELTEISYFVNSKLTYDGMECKSCLYTIFTMWCENEYKINSYLINFLFQSHKIIFNIYPDLNKTKIYSGKLGINIELDRFISPDEIFLNGTKLINKILLLK